MNILAIDTTGKHLTVALKHNEKWNAVFNKDCNLNHSIILNEQIDKLMKQSNLCFADLDAYACNVGVGSFTGIRVGIATIKGFCLARPKKLISVNTFEILAYNEGKRIAVLVPDNRGYYCQNFIDGKPASQAAHFTEKPVCEREIIFDNETDYTQKFISLIDEKVTNGDFCDELEPLYIRKSQAEEGR
jgi:tRNA threonylcarbamoyl adenosine modification protein YeaZ